MSALRAGRHATHAKQALLQAEQHLSARDLEPARNQLVTARQSLRQVKSELKRLGPILPVTKRIPLLGDQVTAVETYQAAGSELAEAGLELADATQQVLDNTRSEAPLAGAVRQLRTVNDSLAQGSRRVRAAAVKVVALDGLALVGPLAQARDELLDKLPGYAEKARSAQSGLDAFIRFAGGEGDRRYLFLSQNPDEIRPTGGFMGTFGTVVATAEGIRLERFTKIQDFFVAHPNVVVPGREAGSPFRFTTFPSQQTIADVNNTPDFVRAGRLAADLWHRAGEPRIDGVVSFTPAFLARILGVVGAVRVEDYGETVDHDNLIERFAYYTSRLEFGGGTAVEERKGFIGALAEAVMGRLLAAPSTQWLDLGDAVAKGFNAREAMAWSNDERVAAVLAERRWDFTLPETAGDFFYNAEFSYLAKFNRALQRTFDHDVELRADGSARVTTTMTITNPLPSGFTNPGSLSYVTIYGPTGAELHPTSDAGGFPEPSLAGHPAAGWFVNAPPLGRAQLTVVWEVKELLQRGPDGTRQYSLWWLRVPDHTGDVLNLTVKPPAGWRWKGSAPPATVNLDKDVRGTWRLERAG